MHVRQTLRRTYLDMNEDELRDLVRKERKAKARLQKRLRDAEINPQWCRMEGNRGGSFVEMHKASDDKGNLREGMVHLCVGESCVVTVDTSMSVAALAAILTRCRDVGFQKMLDAYMENAGGTPPLHLDRDVSDCN